MQIENQYERSFGRYSPAAMNKNEQREDFRESRIQQTQQAENEDTEQMGLLQQFKQQMMKAWQPVPTLTKTIILFFIMAAIFLSIGIAMLIVSKNLSESTFRYDTLQSSTCPINSSCNVTLQVSEMLSSPVFVYYEIHNFYQNHRLYASSYSFDQLTGTQISSSTAESQCSPIVYNRDVYRTVSAFNSSVLLNPNDVANPCGMIALTVFNDSYVLYSTSGSQIPISSNGIAWPTDIENYKIVNPDKMWYNTSDQRFMNWMRIAALSTFRKLWGRIQQDIPPGNYTLQINNFYDISKINGQKYFVLSTSNFFGSKSNFLSISYISVGSVCLLMGFLFLMRKLSKKSKVL